MPSFHNHCRGWNDLGTSNQVYIPHIIHNIIGNVFVPSRQVSICKLQLAVKHRLDDVLHKNVVSTNFTSGVSI